MNHAITLGGLLLFLGIIGGLVMIGFGVLKFFVGSMSDAPEAGEAAGKQGCIIAAVGLVLLVGCILKLVL